jgi:hypothetical protein
LAAVLKPSKRVKKKKKKATSIAVQQVAEMLASKGGGGGGPAPTKQNNSDGKRPAFSPWLSNVNNCSASNSATSSTPLVVPPQSPSPRKKARINVAGVEQKTTEHIKSRASLGGRKERVTIMQKVRSVIEHVQVELNRSNSSGNSTISAIMHAASQATPAKQIRQLQLMLPTKSGAHDLPDVIFEDCEPHDLGEGWND